MKVMSDGIAVATSSNRNGRARVSEDLSHVTTLGLFPTPPIVRWRLDRDRERIGSSELAVQCSR